MTVSIEIAKANTFEIAEGMNSIPTDRIMDSLHKELEGIKPQAILSFKNELGLSEEACQRLVRVEEELDKAIQSSIFLNQSKSLVDFRIGQFLAIFEESLPEGYFDVWIKSKIPEEKYRSWQLRYTQWKQLQFAVALGAARQSISPEDYLLQHSDISSQIWYMLGSRRCPEEVSCAAYSLIEEGHQLQQYQLMEARRQMMIASSGAEQPSVEINKEEKIQLAKNVIQKAEYPSKRNRSSGSSGVISQKSDSSDSSDLEILDAEYTQVPEKDGTLSLIDENRRLRELLSIEKDEKEKLLIKVNQLQAQLDLYKAAAAASNSSSTPSSSSTTVAMPEENERLAELKEMPLSEVRKKAATTSSVMDLKDIADAFGITLVETYNKEIIRGEILAALPQAFEEDFSE